jgi:hypothetical protein
MWWQWLFGVYQHRTLLLLISTICLAILSVTVRLADRRNRRGFQMTSVITPTEHEKAEWSRLAQAAYKRGKNAIGHRYSVAASHPRNSSVSVTYFDYLQHGYRQWLVSNEWPS